MQASLMSSTMSALGGVFELVFTVNVDVASVGGVVGCASVTKVFAHPHLMQEKFGPHFPCGSYSTTVEALGLEELLVV